MAFFGGVDWRVGPSIRNLFAAIIVLIVLPVNGAGEDVWTVTNGPTTHDLNRIALIDSLHGWAAGDSGTIIMTTDGGDSWTPQNSTTDFDIVDISFADEKHGWALAQEYPADTIYTYGTELLRTTDGGQNWFLERRFDEFYFYAVKFIDSSKGLIGGALGKILWTENGGTSWTTAVIDSPDFARWTIYRFNFYDSLYGLALGGHFDVNGLVWKTTDGGKFWDHQRVSGEPLFDSYFLDSTNVLCVSGDLDVGSGMVRTTNAGENWAYTYLGIWGQATSVSFRTAAEGWSTLGFSSTFMMTTDTGRTWTGMFTPDSSRVFDVVFLDSTCGFIVGGEGTILRYTGPPTTVREDKPDRPRQVQLLQNYPNPFNPRTIIRYDLAEKSDVNISVVDMAGQEVARYDRGIQDPGQHQMIFEGRMLASGIYFCRISIDPAGTEASYSRSVKMVLLR